MNISYKTFTLVLFGLFACFCMSCSPRLASLTRQTGNSYEIKGVKYTTYKEAPVGSFEQGIASWYGPGFHGKKTASGEIYDMNALSAAHKTLPLGSIIHVVNMDNSKEVIVRVNDRGPFSKKRILDVSKGAAEKLGMIKSGVARIRYCVIDFDKQHGNPDNMTLIASSHKSSTQGNPFFK